MSITTCQRLCGLFLLYKWTDRLVNGRRHVVGYFYYTSGRSFKNLISQTSTRGRNAWKSSRDDKRWVYNQFGVRRMRSTGRDVCKYIEVKYTR